MLYLTQLIYIKEGQEHVFNEFESVAIPIIAEYGGKLEMRTRITKDNWIDGAMEQPYEVHLVSFPTEADFTAFMNDEKRKSFIHLKEQSIRASLLIAGETAI